MTYKDLIRKVHPDLNPGLPNATEMSQLVNINKNNPFKLKELAQQWGFLSFENIKKHIFKIKDWVIYSNKGLKSAGLLYKIVHIMSNVYEYYIYDINYNKFLKIKCSNGNEPFKFSHTASDEELRNAYLKYQTHINRNQVLLQPNRNYNFDNIYVTFRHFYGRFKVIKTTAKMVFYYDERIGQTKRCSLSKVRNAERG